MYLSHRGTLQEYEEMEVKWLLVNHHENKSLTSAAAECLNLCQDGTAASLRVASALQSAGTYVRGIKGPHLTLRLCVFIFVT